MRSGGRKRFICRTIHGRPKSDASNAQRLKNTRQPTGKQSFALSGQFIEKVKLVVNGLVICDQGSMSARRRASLLNRNRNRYGSDRPNPTSSKASIQVKADLICSRSSRLRKSTAVMP